MSTADSNSMNAKSDAAGAGSERPLVRFLRLAMLGAVVALACFVAYRLGDTYAAWREVTNHRPIRESVSPADSAFATAMMPLAGSWSFDDLDWNIKSVKVSNADVAARFAAAARASEGASPESLPDVSDQFLTLAANLEITPIDQAGNKIYKLDRPEFQGQLVSREVAGHAKIISVAAATLAENDEWMCYELSPRATFRTSSPVVEHLLPVPAAAKHEGGKFGVKGELLLELISLDTNANDLVNTWRAAGWELHETGLGDGTAFNYLVVRGNETIYAWSADAKDSLHNLMLVRNPGSGDTEAKP